MTITQQQLAAAAEALRLVLKFEHPADAVLSQYFRDKRALGVHDRAFVAESVFGVLRRRCLLDHVAPGADARRIVLAWLARVGGRSQRELGGLLDSETAEWLARVRAVPLAELPFETLVELPDWVIAHLRTQMPDSEIAALGGALQQPAPLDLRVNTVRADRGVVLHELVQGGMRAEPTPYSPVGIRLAGKPAVQKHRLFLNGSFEVQDEGSQLLAYLLAPTRHDLAVDFCAGAGGKSLMLGAMMRSQGRVYAFDISQRRLARLKPRLKRSGLSNLHPQLIRDENDARIKRLAGKVDRVLVDAPCSGFGTLRRNPDLKYRQSPQSVAELAAKQAAILSSAARLLRPGGRLVYATCSLLTQENDAIVDAFLSAHAEFVELDCAELLRTARIPLNTGRRLRLMPHLHRTDGFFAAALERNSSRAQAVSPKRRNN